jgi:hypothetical protein
LVTLTIVECCEYLVEEHFEYLVIVEDCTFEHIVVVGEDCTFEHIVVVGESCTFEHIVVVEESCK